MLSHRTYNIKTNCNVIFLNTHSKQQMKYEHWHMKSQNKQQMKYEHWNYFALDATYETDILQCEVEEAF